MLRYIFGILLLCLSLFSQELEAKAVLTNKLDTTKTPAFSTFHIKSLNTNGLDFCPIYYGDDLIFISERELDLINYGENRYSKLSYLSVQYSHQSSLNNENKYSRSRNFSVRINQLNHNGPITFSGDGNYAIFTRTQYEKHNFKNTSRPKLYSAVKEDNKWKQIKLLNLGGEQYSNAHPSISKDGKTLYFTSNREGGFGGYDIYKSTQTETGWSEPQNLGSIVNSSKNEVFPYFHNDEMLFFSSDGYNGNGGLDIYYSLISDKKLTNPKHLDSNINSNADDFGFILDSNNEKGFFSSNREGGKGKDDIYGFTVLWRGADEKKLEITGRFRFTNLPPKRSSGLDVYLISENNEPVDFQITDIDGYFMFKNLPLNNNYLIKTENKIQELELEILNISDQPITLTGDSEGKFLYRKLAYKQFDEVPFLFSSTIDSINNLIYKSFEGRLSGNHGKEQKIYVYNEKNEIRDSVVSDKDGNFSFHQLPDNENFHFKTNKYYQDIELWAYKNNKKIAEMIQNKNGEFVFVKLLAKTLNELKLIPISDSLIGLETDIEGYHLKWIARNDKKNVLSGRFKYTKLPFKSVDGLKVLLLDENNEIISSTTTQDGYFIFRNLPLNKKYIVKATDPNGLELEMINTNTSNISFVSNSEGKFVYRKLSYKNADKLDFLFGSEINLDDEYISKSFRGQLRGNNIAGKQITLLNKDGEKVAFTTTNEKGEFDFKALPYYESYLVQMEETDQDIVLFVLLEDEVVAEMAADSSGKFVYVELKNDNLAKLGLLEVNDNNMIPLENEFTSYDTKWVRSSLKKKSITGRFLFNDLPFELSESTKVLLVNEENEIVQSKMADKNGVFVFENLPYNRNFIVKLEEQIPGLLIELMDENNIYSVRLANNENGEFLYQELSYKDFKDIKFLYTSDGNLEEGKFTKSLKGKFVYEELPYKDISDLEIYLINDVGEIVYTTSIDENGHFSFENLPPDGNYIIKTNQQISNMEILIFNEDKVVAKLSENKENKFVYIKLPFKVAGQLTLMDINDNSHLIATRGLSPYEKYFSSQTAVLSEDSKSAFIYSAIHPKIMDELALMKGKTLGLCPETEDLSLEEIEECVDFTIEELLANESVNKTIPMVNDTIVQLEKPVEAQRFLLYFEFDSEQLTSDSKKIIKKVVSAIKSKPKAKVHINTHTDTKGKEPYNMRLSKRRSDSLFKHFVSLGISSSKIITQHFGELMPVVKCPGNCSEEQHQENRRAEITIN